MRIIIILFIVPNYTYYHYIPLTPIDTCWHVKQCWDCSKPPHAIKNYSCASFKRYVLDSITLIHNIIIIWCCHGCSKQYIDMHYPIAQVNFILGLFIKEDIIIYIYIYIEYFHCQHIKLTFFMHYYLCIHSLRELCGFQVLTSDWISASFRPDVWHCTSSFLYWTASVPYQATINCWKNCHKSRSYNIAFLYY